MSLEVFANPFVAMGVVSALAALGIVAHVWVRRETNGARPYAGLMILLSLWAALYVFQLLAPTVVQKQPFFTARHSIATMIAVLYWVFAARYTDRDDPLSARYMGPIVATCLLLVAGIAINPATLYWTPTGTVERYGLVLLQFDVGPLFWLNVSYVALVVAGGHFVLADTFTGALESYSTQIAAILLIGCLEFGLIFVFVSEHTPILPVLNPWPPIQLLTYAPVIAALPILWSGFSATVFDIRPLARQAVIQGMDDAVFVVDGNGCLRYTNPTANKILGRPADSTAAATDAETAFATHPILLGHYLTACTDSTSAPPNETQTDVVTCRIDGEQCYYDVSISPVLDSAHDSTGAVIVARDVTELRTQREQLHERTVELEAKTAQLERQNERLDQFGSYVSHDLRNPLQIASGYLELARETEDLSYLDDIDDAIERMSEMVDDLRNLTRVDQHTIDPEPVDLELAATSAWSYVDTREAALAVDSNATILVDQDYLGHVLENLFRNAVEHGTQTNGRGSIDLEVTLGTLDNGFYVEDDGVGIPEETRETILEHGFSTVSEGTGLGLSIIRTIADAHDWEIAVTESTAGGARFEFDGVELCN